MARAVLKQGLIYPINPLPAAWQDGQELWVDPLTENHPEFARRWREELRALRDETSAEDDARLQAAVDEVRRLGKEAATREQGSLE